MQVQLINGKAQNEKLQGQFMDSLVKLRLEEYSREGVSCDHIEFPNNAAQVELLDHRRHGVFALLDEQCRAPAGTDVGPPGDANTAVLAA